MKINLVTYCSVSRAKIYGLTPSDPYRRGGCSLMGLHQQGTLARWFHTTRTSRLAVPKNAHFTPTVTGHSDGFIPHILIICYVYITLYRPLMVYHHRNMLPPIVSYHRGILALWWFHTTRDSRFVVAKYADSSTLIISHHQKPDTLMFSYHTFLWFAIFTSHDIARWWFPPEGDDVSFGGKEKWKR